MNLRALAKQIITDFDREAVENGFVPCSDYEIGKIYLYCPDDKKPCRVKLVDGAFWGTHGLSNHWTWRRVLSGGKLDKEECGYGGAFKNVPHKSLKKAKKKKK